MYVNTSSSEDRAIQKLVDEAGKAGFSDEAGAVIDVVVRLDGVIEDHTTTIDQLTTDLKAAQDELKDAQAEVEKYKGQAAV